jgi:S1-C subfamily serine protease
VGDVLVEVDGKVILTVAALREALLAWTGDRPLPLVLSRDGQRLAVVVPGPRNP